MLGLNHLSTTTTIVILRNEGEKISQGTGFFFARRDENGDATIFLVTNYHVVTGNKPGSMLDPKGTSIEIQFHLNISKPHLIRTVELQLFTTDGKPTWVQSKVYAEADMVVIPLPNSVIGDAKLTVIAAPEWTTNQKVKLQPTTPVTFIGYPYGYYDKTNFLPIWKTGHIASEPLVDFDGKPYFVVDISAFSGMSGSPVFAITHGSYENEDGNIEIGKARKFLGIYASMQILNEKKYLEEFNHAKKIGISHEESLELGHVWKESLLLDIIDGLDIVQYEREIVQKSQPFKWSQPEHYD